MNLEDTRVKVAEQLLGLFNRNIEVRTEAEYPLEELKDCKPAQVRDSSHVAPAANVNQYATQMKSGAKFAPPLITRDGFILDGNTRIAARLKIKDRTAAVLIAQIDYKDATAETRSLLESFGAIANQTSGVRLTNSEAIRQAQSMISRGVTPKKVEELLAVPRTTVNSAIARSNTASRAGKFNIDVSSLNSGQLTGLGRENILSLNDEPYRQLASLVVDAGLTAKELSDIGAAMRETSNDADAVAVVTNARDARKPQIAQRKMTGGETPPASTTVLKHLRVITGFKGRENLLIEANRQHRDDYVKLVSEAIAVLQSVLVEQSSFEQSDAAQ